MNEDTMDGQNKTLNANSASATRTKQFGIINLLTWMIIGGLMTLLILNYGSVIYQNWSFKKLPEDDRQLQAWLDESAPFKITAVRGNEENSLRLERRSRMMDPGFLEQSMSFEPPPWDQLGYEQATLTGGGVNSGLFAVAYGNLLFATIVAFGVIFLLNWFNRKKQVEPSDETADRNE